MGFDKDKENALSKDDKSSKGSIDSRIAHLCSLLNSLDDFFTTSSCAGRVLLIRDPGNKKDSSWLFVSHEAVSADELLEKLEGLPEEEVWFRAEPFILHIACRDIEAAGSLLGVLHDAGVKRAGIISLGNKVVIEAIGNESVSAVVSAGGELIADKEYIAKLVSIANRKLEKNWEVIEKTEKNIQLLHRP